MNAEVINEIEQPSDEQIAIVKGQPLLTLPKDLYIPPDAMEVFLEAFEGPLDLLLYLIRRENLDILDIPIAEITRQYMEYVELMHTMQLELAAEYLVMAAMLAEIKSRMLLPRPTEVTEEEEDPRAELVRRLQEYERFKQAAQNLDQLPQADRDFYTATAQSIDLHVTTPLPKVELKELLMALKDVFERTKLTKSHQIQKEGLSIRERMSRVLERVKSDSFTSFAELFTYEEGKQGVVVTFIAILELLRQSLIEIVQVEPFSPIHVKALA